jgi:hypothetical protein
MQDGLLLADALVEVTDGRLTRSRIAPLFSLFRASRSASSV